MDAGKLFSELVNRPTDQSGGILTGTAVSDSVDGTVMVQMDGSVVAQPGEDEVTLTVSADDFVDGAYVLPSVPYAGSLTITDSGGNELEEQDYELDGARLTIFALSSAPIDIAYQTSVQQQITNDDFDGDRYSLASTTNLTVEEMDSEGAWNPATYTLDGNILTISGIEHQAGIVEFAYVYDVSQVCEPGENVLPDSPDEVSVLGRNSSGVDVVVTDYVLDGNVISLPSTYDAYTVDYPVTTTEEWNVSDQYQEEPLEDSDDAADPAIVTIGHNLQWPPASVVSCTIDGVASTYTLDDVNVVVDAPAVTERWFRLTYDAPVSLQVPASVFATGAFTLPSIPLGSVSTVRAGVVLANTVDDDQLAIASLVVDSPTYSIAYTEQVEQDAVELPCTPYVAEGQFVEIAVVNGMPTVIGASGSGDVTMTLAGDAADAAAAAEEAAAAAQEIAEATGQHVWDYTDGLHITQAEKDAFLQTPTGRNILMNALGILIRDALQYRTVVHDEGLTVYDGQGNAASNVVANILRDLITLGYASESHAEIDYHSLQLVDKEGSTYFHVSDLRNASGQVTVTYEGDGSTTAYVVPFGSYTFDANAVEVDGAVVAFTKSGDPFVLATAPAAGSTVTITVSPDRGDTTAYTLGYRADAVIGAMSVAEGYATEASGYATHAEGYETVASGLESHAEGHSTTASGSYAHAEGERTTASGGAAHAEGDGNTASGWATHAEGVGTQATYQATHAEGQFVTASALAAHAEGDTTTASGAGAHAEGGYSTASAAYAHAEGGQTTASGADAHAEGYDATASGSASHAQNTGTKASSANQTTLGKYNVEDGAGTYAVIIGNGTDDSNRSNALTVDWSGNVAAAGDVSAANLGGAIYTGDMDDLTTSGLYYVSASATNVPESGYGGQCTVSDAGNGYVVQVFTNNAAAPVTYARRRNTGGWGAWALIGGNNASSAVSPTNATAATFEVVRKGENVTLYIDNLRVSTALASGSTVSVGTVPSGYRPAYRVAVPLASTAASNAAGAWLLVTTAGAVSLYNRTGASIATTSALYGTATYSI